MIAYGLRYITRTQTRFPMPQIKEQQGCYPIQQLDLTDSDSITNPTTDFMGENRIGKVLLGIHSIVCRAELGLGTGLQTSSEVPYNGILPFQQRQDEQFENPRVAIVPHGTPSWKYQGVTADKEQFLP